MSVASMAAAVVAGQQSQTRADIAVAIARQQVQAQRDFVAQVAQIAE